MDEILSLFPEQLQRMLCAYLLNRWESLEEIRLRLNKEIELNFHGHVESLSDIVFTAHDRTYVLNQLSEYSLYRMEEELREGYITIIGGHRVGLAGKVSMKNGEIDYLQFITFFNIRIARERLGVGHPLISFLQNKHNGYYHTLIIGAPQSGKTTLIRDLARMISDGKQPCSAKKVAIVDERSEIAASRHGIPQHDIGVRTDVMDACPKDIGMMMMIRSMSPEIVVVDEIGKKEDVTALLDALHAGVTVLCSAHGSSVQEVKNRFTLKQLFKQDLFQRFIILEKKQGTNFQVRIENDSGRVLHSSLVVDE